MSRPANSATPSNPAAPRSAASTLDLPAPLGPSRSDDVARPGGEADGRRALAAAPRAGRRRAAVVRTSGRCGRSGREASLRRRSVRTIRATCRGRSDPRRSGTGLRQGAAGRAASSTAKTSVGRGDALGRGVELHADLPQRKVCLRREQQHEEPDHERERPVEQPEADRHRDDRDRDATRGTRARSPRGTSTRSTFIVSRRYRSVTEAMDAAARCSRPNTLSVDRPCTVSANRAARWCSVRHWRSCTARVANPMSTMKSGIRGIVRSTVSPEIQSCHHITAMMTGVAMIVCTSCGRYRPKYGVERLEPAPGRHGELRGVALREPLGPQHPDRLRRPGRAAGLRRGRRRARRPSRAPTAERRAPRRPERAARRVAARSEDGIPSIAPTIARVRSHAKATMTSVWPAEIAAMATKNPRDALACLSSRGSTGGVRARGGVWAGPTRPEAPPGTSAARGGGVGTASVIRTRAYRPCRAHRGARISARSPRRARCACARRACGRSSTSRPGRPARAGGRRARPSS